MNKAILGYFSKGFSLANRSLDILLISLFFLLFGQLTSLFQDSLVGNVVDLINFILTFFSFGFFMSIPAFLLWKQQNKSLNRQTLWPILIRNTKRMIIPTILFLILMMIFGFSYLLVIAVTTVNLTNNLTNSQQVESVIQTSINQFKSWNPLFIIFETITSFFVFTPIYFSVENNGFFTSAKKSLVLSFKNLQYVVIIMLISAATYSISKLLLTPFDNWGYLIGESFSQYVGLVVTASTLYYYQSR